MCRWQMGPPSVGRGGKSVFLGWVTLISKRVSRCRSGGTCFRGIKHLRTRLPTSPYLSAISHIQRSLILAAGPCRIVISACRDRRFFLWAKSGGGARCGGVENRHPRTDHFPFRPDIRTTSYNSRISSPFDGSQLPTRNSFHHLVRGGKGGEKRSKGGEPVGIDRYSARLYRHIVGN